MTWAEIKPTLEREEGRGNRLLDAAAGARKALLVDMLFIGCVWVFVRLPKLVTWKRG